jgi:2-oxoisovalerate dehydrogenase E2 component (dihydrolipoyl transacylase)
MAERVFLLPDPGEGLTEAELIEWLVAEGDQVELNQPIAEVETSKAAVELPSPYAGRVVHLHAAAGTLVPVGQPLITIDVPGLEEEPQAEAANVRPYEPRRSTQRREGTAPEASARATPAVRKLARDLEVDLGALRGSGPQGRITAEDVRAASGTRAATVSEDLRTTREPLTAMRRQIADNLSQQARIPQATTFRTVDASALESVRGELEMSPLPFLLAALCRTVSDHPRLNASWGGDHISVHDKINVGLAAATERGLMVPVLRDAGRLSLRELAGEIRRIANAARDGHLGVADMTNATIAVSNTGSYGSEAGTPILSPGTSVTLAIGVIAPRALVEEGEVVATPACTLSLTFDHRVLDGAEVGHALTDLVNLLQDPVRLRDLAG